MGPPPRLRALLQLLLKLLPLALSLARPQCACLHHLVAYRHFFLHHLSAQRRFRSQMLDFGSHDTCLEAPRR